MGNVPPVWERTAAWAFWEGEKGRRGYVRCGVLIVRLLLMGRNKQEKVGKDGSLKI